MRLLRNILGTLAVLGLMAILFWWVAPLIIGVAAGVWIAMTPIIGIIIIILLIVSIIKQCNKKG